MTFKIGIVGAGPGGCMLARLLLQSDQDISVVIFEAESSLNFRSQGGTLDLHEKDGQAALKAAGLFEEFQKYARYDGEAVKMADKNFLCYLKFGPGKSTASGGRPEIDRFRLREMLFNSLPEGTVKWNKKLKQVDDNLNLHFADGSVESDLDLIVGADGAWSRVRSILTDIKPSYAGIAGHQFTIPNAQERTPDLYELVNRGNLFSWSDGKGMMAQYMGDGSIFINAWRVRPTDWQQTCGYDVYDGTAVRKAYAADYADWDPRLVAFMEKADNHVVPRDMFTMPTGHQWKHISGVTLLGDAAHLAPPSGEGVNIALEDCLKLSQAIISAASAESLPDSEKGLEPSQRLDLRVQAFEKDMFVRGTRMQQQAHEMTKHMYFEAGAPRSNIERFILSAMKDELGKVGTMLVAPLVYAYFFIFRLIW